MARAQHTYSVRLAVDGGGRVKAELREVGQSGERSLKKIEAQGKQTSLALGGLGDRAAALGRVFRSGLGALGIGAGVGGLALFADRAITAADAIGKTADKIGVGVEALQELRYAAQSAGVEQRTLDMALQRFTRRAAEAAKGTGEAKAALEQMGIQLRDGSGHLRTADDLLGDVADAFAGIEDPAERVRLAFKLFDSEGVAMVNMLRDGRGALDSVRQRARDLGIVLDEKLVHGAERARNEFDTLGQVIKINLTRAVLDAAPEIADLSTTLSEALPPALGLASGAARLFANELAVVARLAAAIRDQDLPAIFDTLSRGGYVGQLRGLVEGLLTPDAGATGAWEGPAGATGSWEAGGPGARKPPLTSSQVGLPPVTTTGAPAPGSFRAAQGGVLAAPQNAAIVAAGRYTAELERMRATAEAARNAIGGRASAAQTAAREAERAAQEEARAREEAVREIEQIRDAYLQATDQQIALIERRRDRELAALSDLKLSEQELAEARSTIVATAAEEIAGINARAAEESAREWEAFGDGLVGVFTSAALSADNFGEAITRGLLQFAGGQAERLLDPLGDKLGGWLGDLFGDLVGGGEDVNVVAATTKGLTFHRGGRVGIDPVPARQVPAALFAVAPRLHSGLAADEYPAILQRVETVIPRGAAPATPVQVIINNNAGAQVSARQTGLGRSEVDIDEAVAGAIAFGRATPRALDQHRTLTRY